MKKGFTLFIIFIIFVISFLSLILILNYLDPFSKPILAVSFLVLTFIFSITSFFCLILYFFKKIYYRWEVYEYHIKTSFRQGFFIALFFLFSIIFYIFKAPLFVSISLLLIFFIFLELFISNLKQN